MTKKELMNYVDELNENQYKEFIEGVFGHFYDEGWEKENLVNNRLAEVIEKAHGQATIY